MQDFDSSCWIRIPRILPDPGPKHFARSGSQHFSGSGYQTFCGIRLKNILPDRHRSETLASLSPIWTLASSSWLKISWHILLESALSQAVIDGCKNQAISRTRSWIWRSGSYWKFNMRRFNFFFFFNKYFFRQLNFSIRLQKSMFVLTGNLYLKKFAIFINFYFELF